MASTNLISIERGRPPLDTHDQNWHDQRRGYIGASESASMFADPALPKFGQDGIKYGCARRLVYEKRGQVPDFPRTAQENEILLRGTELEDLVVDKFQRETGLRVRRQPTRLSKAIPHMGVNIDRMIYMVTPEQFVWMFGNVEAASGPGVLEVKTANEFVFKKIEGADGVPADYAMQLQHAMAVTGYNWGCFAVLGYGPALWRMSWFTMLRDDKMCAEINRRVEQVWPMVQGLADMPMPLPQPDKRCPSCMFRKTCLGSIFMPPATDGAYEPDESLQDVVADYIAAKQVASEFEDTLAGKRLALAERLGDRQRVEVPSLNARIRYAPQQSERIDAKALRAKYPEAAKDCVKISNSRPLVVEVV